MIIYKVTNKINGKIYIGQTVNSLKKRISEHVRSNVGYFSKALKKYGKQGFDFSIIETCETKTMLNEREIYWIGYCNSIFPNGYNLTSGGERPPSQKGVKRSAETMEKLRGNKNALGVVRSYETKEKMAAAKIGNQYSLGRKRSEETKRKMSLTKKGRCLSDKHKMALSIAAKQRMTKYPMPWGFYNNNITQQMQYL